MKGHSEMKRAMRAALKYWFLVSVQTNLLKFSFTRDRKISCRDERSHCADSFTISCFIALINKWFQIHSYSMAYILKQLRIIFYLYVNLTISHPRQSKWMSWIYLFICEINQIKLCSLCYFTVHPLIVTFILSWYTLLFAHTAGKFLSMNIENMSCDNVIVKSWLWLSWLLVNKYININKLLTHL